MKGEKLALLRKACRMPQHVLAGLVGRSVHSIRAIEQGKFGIGDRLAVQLSLLTGVSPDWLRDDSPGPPFDMGGNEMTLTGVRDHFLAMGFGSGGPMGLDPSFLGIRLESSLQKAETLRNYPSIAGRVRKFLDELDQEIKAARGSEKKEPDQEIKSVGSKKKRP